MNSKGFRTWVELYSFASGLMYQRVHMRDSQVNVLTKDAGSGSVCTVN